MDAVMTKAGKKLFEKHLEQYAPVDPLYEEYTDDKGKKKRRRRQLPPGLSKRDAKILMSVKKRAHYLDKGFSICGIRFGWTFLIGLIPGAGDVVDAFLNYALVLRKCRQAEIPPWLLRQMLLNNIISATVGLIPFAGDVILGMYKANSRNAALLEEFLRVRGLEYEALRKEGKDPEAIAAAARAAQKKDKKGKGKEALTAEYNAELGRNISIWKRGKKESVSKADAQQVLPGAGVKPGEGVTTGGVNTMPGGDVPVTTDAKKKRSGSLLFGKKSPAGDEKGKSTAIAEGDEKANKRGSRFIEDVPAEKK